jgi:glucosylceramidase
VGKNIKSLQLGTLLLLVFGLLMVSLSVGTMQNTVLANGQAVQVYWSSEVQPMDGAWYQAPINIPYKLSQQPNLTVNAIDSSSMTTITIDPGVTYQTMQGIGSSLEESTVYNLARMSAGKRAEVLKALVDPVNGIGMNLMRICGGTSDFTGRAWYSYDDMPVGQTDPNLTNFSIQKDIDYNVISVIKEALSYNPNLKFFMSPWSPPGWMKDSGTMTGGSLKPENYAVAAKYYRMAIQAYQAQGIPIYAFTIQNEPGVSSSYPSCSYSWQQERDFVKAVKNEFTANNITAKVWILDHNFDMATNYAGQILADPSAYAATDGIAFHDYSGNPPEMSTLHNAYPDKEIFFTERSVWGTEGMDRITQYIRNWACTYNAWVTMLDQNRKPNNGPFTADPTLAIQSTSNYDTYWFIPEYYLTGQFSKFVQFGAKRIKSNYGSSTTVTNVAFLNPDNTIVTVVINQTATSQQFKILTQNGQIVATIPAKSVATYKWIADLPIVPIPTPAPVWFQNFESGNGFSAGTNATTIIDNSSANPGGVKCVNLTVTGLGDPGDSTQCVNITPQNGSSIDASMFDYLTFFIKDTQGANSHKVTIIDTSNAKWSNWVNIYSVLNQWKKIAMPLENVGGVNLAAIKEIRIGEYNPGTYYIDDVYFAASSAGNPPPFGPTATPGPTSTPVPTATPGPTSTPVPTATPGPTSTPMPTSTPTPTPTPIPSSAIPGKIEAENYSAMSGIQTESCSEGTLDVGWIDTGDWMDYNVNVSTTGSYTVQYRIASPNTTGQIQLKSGSTVLATTNVPNTGGWQNWQTVTATVSLSAGAQTLRLYASGGGWNINWFEFTLGSGPTPTPGGSSSVWYQNFESGTGFTAGTGATVASYADTANTGGSKCVKLTFSSSGDPGTSSNCVNVTPQSGSSIDASSKNYLIFFVKDTQGANTIKVTIIDTSNATWSGWTSAQSVQNQWTKISVALSSVSGINKAAIKEIRLGEWNAGTYYFDDMYCAVNSSDGIPGFGPTPTPGPTATPTPTPSGFKWAFEDANGSGTWNWSITWSGNGSSIEVGSYNDLPGSTAQKYAGASSIKFHFTHAGGAGNAGGSITTKPDGTGVEPTSQAERDAGKNLSSYNYLRFYIKGDSNSQARIKIRDTSDSETAGVELTGYVTPSSTWQVVTIPLSAFNWTNVNKASIKELKFLIESNTYSAGSWTFYLDNIEFIP